ncbi:MAG TPA: glycoside hydrolase family 3 N-terminal domain-containing protein, partial [Phycisphaerae bacterium]|nr:glycoside hydrolase family 3 N-terminal domain-containing protein [Phycisphaerae bacterium]
MPRSGSHRLLSLVAFAASLLLVSGGRAEDLPYKDTSLPFDQRVADLVSRMTFAEKADQLQVNISANTRLGIPACRWGTEAMHGLMSGGTMFPDSMALASTWDPGLIQRVASAIGDEARARAGTGMQGLILWCPNLNLARDPRWGRNMETYGEDPYLAGRLAVGYCKGLQGEDPKYLKTLASPKHFAVYSQEAGRNSSNAYVSQRALREYYLKPFEAAVVDGHALGIMSAYNAINSVPCSSNEWLLNTVLRDEWHFDGAVCSDNGAVAQIFSAHHYTDSEEKAVAAAINSGLDLITGNAGPTGAGVGPGASRVTPIIQRAQDQGLFKEGAVDRAVTRSLLMRFKLGMFDPPEKVPYSSLTPAIVGSPQAVDLALRAGREAITLLQNKPAPRGYGVDRLLPLDLRRLESIAIVGPNASLNLYGSYANGAAAPGSTG